MSVMSSRAPSKDIDRTRTRWAYESAMLRKGELERHSFASAQSLREYSERELPVRNLGGLRQGSAPYGFAEAHQLMTIYGSAKNFRGAGKQ